MPMSDSRPNERRPRQDMARASLRFSDVRLCSLFAWSGTVRPHRGSDCAAQVACLATGHSIAFHSDSGKHRPHRAAGTAAEPIGNLVLAAVGASGSDASIDPHLASRDRTCRHSAHRRCWDRNYHYLSRCPAYMDRVDPGSFVQTRIPTGRPAHPRKEVCFVVSIA